MIYLYRCPMCFDHFEIEKSMAEVGREEICPTHRIAMIRIYTAPRINLATLTLREKLDLADHKARTGADLVCVGNERPKSFQPKPEEYTLPREVLAGLTN